MDEDDLRAQMVRRMNRASGAVLVLAVMGFVSVISLIVWVLPVCMDILADMGSKLPMFTRVFLRANPSAWAIALSVSTVGLIGKEFLVRDPYVRLWINIPALVISIALLAVYALAMWGPMARILIAIQGS